MKTVGLVLVILLGGCTLVGPDWQRPKLPLPTAWNVPASKHFGDSQADSAFWSAWGDPRLVDWIQRAQIANRDVRLSAVRIAEARALTRQANAEGQPNLDGNASVVRDRASNQSRFPLRGVPNPVTLYQVGFDASWELDLFGRIQRRNEAAQADLLAANLLQAALKVSLAAEVATHYYNWRAAQAQIAALHRQIEASQALLAIVGSRVRAGFNPELDQRRAEDQAAQTQARLPPVRTAMELAFRRLGILTGGQTHSLSAAAASTAILPAMVPPLPQVLPAQLLDRRPDLRAAEAKAHAAYARIGVAEGERWPHLSLAAALGSLTMASGNLLSANSVVFNGGPQLRIPIFHGGGLEARVDSARAVAQEAVLAWEKSAVEAILEVETAALRQQEAKDRHTLLAQALTAQRHTLDLATLRYQRGMSDFTAPLEVAQQLAIMEIAVIDAHLQLLTSGIALYKALGGGWREKPK